MANSKKTDVNENMKSGNKNTSSLDKYFNTIYNLDKDQSIAREREELMKAFEKSGNQIENATVEVTETRHDGFSEKVLNIKLLFQKKEDNALNESFKILNDLAQSMDNLIIDMPSELVSIVNNEIEFCLENDCTPEQVKERVKTIIYLLQLAYKDSRRYLDIYGRNYQEMLLADFIGEICDLDYTNDDWHRIARMNFDLNGLMTVNQYGVEGHTTGNRLLEIFTDILKNGRTVKALESMGVRVVASAEGGDKFGWVLYGPFDLRPILPIAESLILKEVSEVEIGHFIDFENPKVQELLKQMGVKSDENSKFHLSISVGSASLGEVLENLNVPEDCTYEEMGKLIMNSMFRTADTKAREHKNEEKKRMKKENPALYALHSRSNISILEDRIKELSEEVEKLRAEVKSKK